MDVSNNCETNSKQQAFAALVQSERLSCEGRGEGEVEEEIGGEHGGELGHLRQHYRDSADEGLGLLTERGRESKREMKRTDENENMKKSNNKEQHTCMKQNEKNSVV